MINAGFDPLGRDVFSAKQLAQRFNILRAERVMDGLEAFEPYDDIAALGTDAFFDADDLPEAILFISHRWESARNPDPTKRKFNALRQYLDMIGAVADWKKGWFGPDAKKVALRHGTYQAAYLLGDYNPFDPGASRAPGFGTNSKDTLRKLGVWFDYSCLSKAKDTEAARKEALSRLHDLLGAANLVSFREPGDTFDERGWCAAELSTDPDIERSRVRKICLRLDKLGAPFDISELVKPGSPMAGFTDLLETTLKPAKTGGEVARAVAHFQKTVGVEAEDDRDTPLLFNRRAPYIFAAHEDFLKAMTGALSHITDKPQPGVDLVEIAVQAAAKAGLKTSDAADMAYTSLMILYARHRGAPDMARLYGEALARHLEGRSTRLREFALIYDKQDGWNVFRGACRFAFEDDGLAPKS